MTYGKLLHLDFTFFYYMLLQSLLQSECENGSVTVFVSDTEVSGQPTPWP